jgi:hypothetical protein
VVGFGVVVTVVVVEVVGVVTAGVVVTGVVVAAVGVVVVDVVGVVVVTGVTTSSLAEPADATGLLVTPSPPQAARAEQNRVAPIRRIRVE